MKNHAPAFSRAFLNDFLSYSCILQHFSMLNMTIHVNKLIKCSISTKFKFQIQFVTFRRGHHWTPIDPAPVLLSGKHCSTSHLYKCWDRRQTVNLVSAGGLVEQSNAAKNNAVDKLAGSAAGLLAGWLAAGAAGGWLAGWLLADWLPAVLLLLLLLLAGCCCWLACCATVAGWLAASQDQCCC